MAKTRAPTLFSCLALALAVGACGGGDDDGSGEPAATTTAPERTSPAAPVEGAGEGNAAQGAASGAQGGKLSSPSGEESRDTGAAGGVGAGAPDSLATDPKAVRGARVTARGAVQTLPPSEQGQAEAMDNSYSSIKTFGDEVEGPEATEITFALVQYLGAKASGDWATACARLYSVLRQTFEKDGRACPGTYGALMSRASKSAAAEEAKIDVASVRRGEGSRAFVIYKTPQTLSADMPMYLDGGVWTVGALNAYVLTPEQLREQG